MEKAHLDYAGTARGDSIGIDDMVGEAKEARTAEIVETNDPRMVTKFRVIHGKNCEGKGMHCVASGDLCAVKHFSASEH